MILRTKSWVPCLASLALLLVVSNIVPRQVRAQEKPAAQNEKEREQRQELEKKTLSLVNDIASASWSLKLPENRIFIMSGAADLLWTFDEKRARNLYWDALNSLSSINASVRTTTENPSKAEREKIGQAYFLVYRLRQRLLRQIARRDSQLALDMLRASRQITPRQSASEFPYPDDRQLEQEIASEIAVRDPAQALLFARQSLAKGLTFELLNLLYQLNQQDSEKASLFAGEVVDKLQAANIATDLRASIVALNLLEISRSRDVNGPAKSWTETAKPLSLNDEQKRDLVDILTTAALSVSANSNLLYQITEVMPEIEQFFPERRTALERKLAAFNETLTKQQRDQITFNTLIRRGKAEDLVRSAASADEQTRPHLYNQAAIIAVGRGKADSFREFVSKEVSENGERKQILDFLDAEEITAAAVHNELDQLRSLLPKIRRKEDRARAMAELALILKAKGEDEEAANLLDDAATLIKVDLNDERQTNAWLTLMCGYAVVNPPKAFALAERTVDQANSQISLLLLVDRVIKTGAIKKSEIILEQPGIMPLENLLFRYGKGLAMLAKKDFNRTRALADRFERNELRIMAQLAIAKALLQPAPSFDAARK